MRIAVLFSGRVDGYILNYESLFKGLLKGQEADFFLSHSPELQEDLDGFKKMFNPKILNNDEIVYPDVSNYPKNKVTNRHNTMCMYFNRKRVFEDLKKYMEETGEQYDLYISCRVDSYNISEMNYDLFQDCTDKDIYIPYLDDWGGVNDRFAIGNFKAMETYMSLYDEIIDMLNEGTIIQPELLLLTYLKRKSMNIQRFYYLYSLIKGTVDSPRTPLPFTRNIRFPARPSLFRNLQFVGTDGLQEPTVPRTLLPLQEPTVFRNLRFAVTYDLR